MNAEQILMLLAVLPLIGALICRLDAESPRKSLRLVNLGHVLAMWTAGAVFIAALFGHSSPLSWTGLAFGWTWLVGSWFLRPLVAAKG